MIAHASQGKLDICNATCSALDELMGAAWDDKRYQQLSRIVDDALAFSRILRCQLASFDVRYYDANMAYDSTFMESNLEDDEAKGGPILLTVAPALVKFGNEYGQRVSLLTHRYPFCTKECYRRINTTSSARRKWPARSTSLPMTS